MKRCGKFTIVLVLLFINLFCSKSEEKKEENTQKRHPIHPVLSKVEILPTAPTSSDSIRALPVLSSGKSKYVTFNYQWLVNGKRVPNEDKQLLDRKKYSKGDTVYCLVKASRGKLKSEEVESYNVRIANSPPIINYSEVGSFEVPGEFRYIIDAFDPDGDSLTYHLLTPVDRGITIDSETGIIEWYIDEILLADDTGESEPLNRPEGEEYSPKKSITKSSEKKYEKLPPIVKIVFEVRDSEGAALVSSININLRKGREATE